MRQPNRRFESVSNGFDVNGGHDVYHIVRLDSLLSPAVFFLSACDTFARPARRRCSMKTKPPRNAAATNTYNRLFAGISLSSARSFGSECESKGPNGGSNEPLWRQSNRKWPKRDSHSASYFKNANHLRQTGGNGTRRPILIKYFLSIESIYILIPFIRSIFGATGEKGDYVHRRA